MGSQRTNNNYYYKEERITCGLCLIRGFVNDNCAQCEGTGIKK